MPSHGRMIWAVFKRNFFAYFINPTGYVFITVFILLGAMAAFWQRAFFLDNLANLDQLNAFFPILLLFFVPALTMNVWAEERRQGTDELLFTLPGRDTDIVLGKYLAVLGIYTVAVVFSLSHVVILAWLGRPDLGLMFATYLGYWLTGAALLAVGMVGSLLTRNATVAFILGALFCSVFVFIHRAEGIFGGWGTELFQLLGVRQHFASFGDGVITLSGVVYFIALTAVMLYINVVLVGRRHYRGGEQSISHAAHRLVRAIALGVVAVALCVLTERSGAYVDATAENLHTLQPQTKALIDQIPDDRPVFIQAFFSPEVPQSYVRTRKDLVNVLNRLDDLGGDRVSVVIHDTEPFTEVATEASENYDITARPLMTLEGSRRTTTEIFLGLVFTSGPEEFVLPFFDRGLPVEYELARSIRVVSQADRKKLGIVATDAGLFGGFDFQTMVNRPDWSIVGELRKQYDVERVAPDGPYPDDLDALLVVMPSSMTQPQLDVLREAIFTGTPTLLFDDPLPTFNPAMSPSLPKDAMRNPFTSRGQPPPQPKGNLDGLLAKLGLSWGSRSIVWSQYNPHPALADVEPEVNFIAESADNPAPFNPDSIISAGLQEVVMLFPGFVQRDQSIESGTLEQMPLLTTGTRSGRTAWDQLIQRDMFGLSMNRNPRRTISDDAYTVAVRVTGTAPVNPGTESSGAETDEANSSDAEVPIDVIFVADSDLISETFFSLRREGIEGLNFDNITFALNCIDVLAGDESFVELRKHRPRHRSLTRVEKLSEGYADERRAETEAAEAEAADKLAQAQARLDEKVGELRERTDLDNQTKQIMLRTLQNVENRRFSVVEANIKQQKERSIAAARADMESAVAGIQRNIKWWAAMLPPIPTLLLAIGLFAYRYQREKISVSERRMVETKA